MAPPAMDAIGGGSGRVLSPTAITNSIPRPKSPRRPDYRGDRRGGKNAGFPAAESFNRAYDGKNPKVRRRSHGQMGRFPAESEEIPHVTEPRMCVPMDMGELLTFKNKNAAALVDKSKDYVEKYGPTAKRNFAVCMTTSAHAAGVAGEGIADFTMTAAEVYRQECRSDNRGDDAVFFMEQKQPHEKNDENSLMETSSASENERRDSTSDRSPVRGETKKSKSGPFKTKGRFPEAIHITNNPAENAEISPPRVDRMDTKNFRPEHHAQKQAIAQNSGDLREARMELFHQGQEGVSGPELRLARALEDMYRQDQTIDGLKKQLQYVQKHLDETFQELQEAKGQAQEKQFKTTEIRARAVQDRKRLEDTYEKEVEQNKKLQDNVSQLQVEVSTLKMCLRGARADGQVDSRKNESSTSTQVIALKADIVDLRSQLAEAHASNIDDTSTLNSLGESDELRKKLREAETEVKDLRVKDLDVRKLQERQRQAEALMKEKVERVEASAKESKARLEDKLNASVQTDKDVRAELIRVKVNLQRLERERSRKRLHSSADVDRLNRQLNKAKEDVIKLKQQQTDDEKAVKAETSQMKKELEDVQRKLALASRESTTKNTGGLRDRRRLEKERTSQSQEIKDLKQQLSAKDDSISTQVRKIADLEVRVRNGRPHQIASGASSQEVALLDQELKFRKANEASLRAELKLQKTLLAEARVGSATPEGSSSSLKTLDESNIVHLRRQLDYFKKTSVDSKDSNELEDALRCEITELKKLLANAQAKARDGDKPEEVRAKEQSFLNQISILKAGLNEAEAKSKEEMFRAEEERRISRENEAERMEETDRLRHEKEKAIGEKMQLKDELNDIRRQLELSASAGEMSVTSVKSLTSTSTDMEVPNNVKRLRNELAMARARLSAARDQSRALNMRDHPLADSLDEKRRLQPGSPEKSVDSTGSSWAPPGFKSADPPNTPPRNVATISAALRTPPWTIATIQKPRTFVDASSTASVSAAVRTFEVAKPKKPVVRTALGKPKKKAGVEELQKQLEASSKRLQAANTILNGLVGETNVTKDAADTKSYYFDSDTLLTIVRADDDSNESGVIDEVVSSASGSIEVNRRQFADI